MEITDNNAIASEYEFLLDYRVDKHRSITQGNGKSFHGALSGLYDRSI